MQVGDLVKDRHGNVGIITKGYWGNHKHWWVHWTQGSSNTIHERWPEVINEDRSR